MPYKNPSGDIIAYYFDELVPGVEYFLDFNSYYPIAEHTLPFNLASKMAMFEHEFISLQEANTYRFRQSYGISYYEIPDIRNNVTYFDISVNDNEKNKLRFFTRDVVNGFYNRTRAGIDGKLRIYNLQSGKKYKLQIGSYKPDIPNSISPELAKYMSSIPHVYNGVPLQRTTGARIASSTLHSFLLNPGETIPPHYPTGPPYVVNYPIENLPSEFEGTRIFAFNIAVSTLDSILLTFSDELDDVIKRKANRQLANSAMYQIRENPGVSVPRGLTNAIPGVNPEIGNVKNNVANSIRGFLGVQPSNTIVRSIRGGPSIYNDRSKWIRSLNSTHNQPKWKTLNKDENKRKTRKSRKSKKTRKSRK
jgi:hypothetical protein